MCNDDGVCIKLQCQLENFAGIDWGMVLASMLNIVGDEHIKLVEVQYPELLISRVPFVTQQ